VDASRKEWRREDGAHKKAHLQTVEYSVKAIGAGIDAHFLFLYNNFSSFLLNSFSSYL